MDTNGGHPKDGFHCALRVSTVSSVVMYDSHSVGQRSKHAGDYTRFVFHDFPMYAGQSTGVIHDLPSAADVVRSIMAEASDLMIE